MRLQGKLGKQNLHKDVKKSIEPVTDSVKKSVQETTGAVKVTTKAIEIKGEERNRAINGIEDLISYAINVVLRILEPIGEVAISETQSEYRLRVNPISKWLYVKKIDPLRFMENHFFIDG